MIELSHITKIFRVSKRNSGMKEAIKALVKREYTLVHALSDLSFTIDDGEMVGYIGPNGAGKSSTIKIMSGILTPDSGTCVIDGLVPWKNRIKHVSNIGVVFGQRSQLWWDVPVIDSFELLRDIYRVDEKTYRNNLDELTSLLGIGEIIRTPTRQLSLGQRMRCEIAASLLHSPKILFLDEPTIGLDSVSKIAVREFIRKLNREKGTTVILTTHDMQDIEALTQRILLIGSGKILLDVNLDELKARNSKIKRIRIMFSGNISDDSGKFDNMLAEIGGISVISLSDGQMQLAVDTEKTVVSQAIELVSKMVEITDISVEGTTAEELVVSLYKEYGI